MATERTEFLQSIKAIKDNPKRAQSEMQQFHDRYFASLRWHLASHASLSVIAVIRGQRKIAIKEGYLMVMAFPVYIRDGLKK